VSSTATRAGTAGAAGAELAALDAAGDSSGEEGAVEAGAAPVDVPAVDVLVVGDEGAADDATGVAVGGLACLEPDPPHAVANAASATRAAARRYVRGDVSTGLLWVALAHHETPTRPDRLCC
jgi:hypothetical protein